MCSPALKQPVPLSTSPWLQQHCGPFGADSTVQGTLTPETRRPQQLLAQEQLEFPVATDRSPSGCLSSPVADRDIPSAPSCTRSLLSSISMESRRYDHEIIGGAWPGGAGDALLVCVQRLRIYSWRFRSMLASYVASCFDINDPFRGEPLLASDRLSSQTHLIAGLYADLELEKSTYFVLRTTNPIGKQGSTRWANAPFWPMIPSP